MNITTDPIANDDSASIDADKVYISDFSVLDNDYYSQEKGATIIKESTGAEKGPKFKMTIVLPQKDPNYEVSLYQVNGEAADEDGNFSVTLSSGAKVSMDVNGYFQYDPSGYYDGLAEGEQALESFSYTVIDTNGVISTATVELVIYGVNEAPILEADSATVIEDNFDIDNPTQVSANGQIMFDDVDTSDINTLSLTSADGTQTKEIVDNADGSKNIEASVTVEGLYGILTLKGDGSWTYYINNESSKVQALAEGQSAVEKFAISYSDRSEIAQDEIVITVQGTNDLPEVVNQSLTGILVEDQAVNELETLVADGFIEFTDVDLIDTHSVAVNFNQSTHTQQLGQLVATIDQAATGGEIGEINWTYTLDNQSVQFLAQGQTIEEIYNLTVSDGQGGEVTREIMLSIEGTNDAPMISSEELSGQVLEDNNISNGLLESSGLLTFSDVDLIDTHSVVVNFNQSTHTQQLGQLVATIDQAATGGEVGEINWTYTLDNQLVQFLAQGQTIEEIYNLTVSDGQGGEVTREIMLTIEGTNDAPVISSEELSGQVLEDNNISNCLLESSGLLTFSDVDLTDTHNVAVNFNQSTHTQQLGQLVASIDKAATGGETGEINWSYTLDNQSVQFLAQGESIEEIYNLTLSDGQGGEVERAIKISIEGTNDAPVISSEELSGQVLEDNNISNGLLESSGLLTFSDVDLTDTHSVAVNFNQSTHTQQLGQLVASIDKAATGGEVGEINWSYTLDNQSVQFLAQGEMIEEVYKLTLSDGQGATVEREVAVTIEGSNDAPTLESDFGEITVSSGVDSQTTGMLLFDDVDASDINTLSVTSADGSVVETIQDKADGSKNTTEMVMVNGQYGALTLYGSGSWTYTVNSEHQDVQALILGESLIEEFSVSYSDGANLSNPVSAQEKIEVTLLGSFVVGPPLEPTIFSDENDLLGFDFASYNFVESYEHAINNGNGLSLREAVILSNNYDLELANTLYLSEGNYTLSLAGAYEDFAATGDLDILSNLNIQGAGVGKTTIDGGGIDRVFDLDGIDAQLNLNDLTLTGGKVTQQNNDDDPYAQYGGGIRASNQATLNLENTEVVGNEAKFGGGINGNISAEININNSSIANNLASQRGAAGDFMSPIAVI
jgi:VCBS repeat-containing protein